MHYRSEIDGLRAIAIIPVVFFHGGFSLVSGGFVGVDVFFVISGYLITLFLYSSLSNNSFSASQFYERRIKRLFPAIFFITTCCSIISWFLLQPYELEEYYGSLASVFVFASNIHFYHHSGYFDTSSELNPLLHTWSLSVEEQFYLVFPWILLLAFKAGKKTVWTTVSLLIITSFCLAEWRVQEKPMAAFYFLYARSWELMIGSFCALLTVNSQLTSKTPQTLKECLSWLGLTFILFSIFTFSDATPVAGRYTLLPTIGTALIILFCNSQSSLGKLLSHRSLVFIGLLSYSTYLWHQPLLAFSRYYFSESFDFAISAGLCILSFILAYFTWKFIEQPFRHRLWSLNSKPRTFSIFFLLSIAIISASLYGKNEKGFPDRLDPNIRSIYETTGHFEEVETCFITTSDKFDLSKCLKKTSKQYNALIIGDSHAASLFPSLQNEFEKRSWNLSMLTYARCVPFISESYLQQYRYNSRFFSKNITPRCQALKENFRTGLKGSNFDLIIVLNHFHNWIGTYNEQSIPRFWEMYTDTLIENFGKEKLLILGALPVWKDDLPKLIIDDFRQGKNHSGPSFSGLFDTNRKLDNFMFEELNKRDVQFLSTMSAFCSSKGCERTGILNSGERKALAYDEAHLSSTGADLLSKYIISNIINFQQP